MKISNSRKADFPFLKIMIVVIVATVGLLLAIVVYGGFANSLAFRQKKTCIANLYQIERVKAIWAIENKKVSSDTPMDADLFGYRSYNAIPSNIYRKPSCPAGGSYTLGRVGNDTTCSKGGTLGHSL